jgi:hypothetical protein
MATDPKLPLAPNVMPFEKFWKWLQGHPNCILSAGTPEAVLYDDEELHWHFGAEEDGVLLVQVVRGKALLGEIAISPETISYVQSESKGEEEYVFECVAETDTEPVAAYHFTLSHDYNAEETVKQGRWVH